MKYNIVVKPGSKTEEVTETTDGLLIRTHARAHDGEANAAVVKLLAKHFGVSKSQVSITAGMKSKHKVVEILGLDA